MPRTRSRIQELRHVIDCMPPHTRAAMLDGVRGNEIIAGAYSSRDGGICPMVAAHRCGGRTDYISFARAWDRFTGTVTKRNKARRATRREIGILVAQLEASLLAEEQHVDLGAAIDEHQRLRARPAPAVVSRRAPTGERNRSSELARSHGWSWLRPFRSLDEYERALAALGSEESSTREREPVA